jgi:L-fuconolactonase
MAQGSHQLQEIHALRLDSHQHFWRYNPAEYPWIPKNSALHRDWLPTDWQKAARPCGVGGCVAVQARQTLDETQWLLELAEHHPFIKAVVGWVDLRSDHVEAQLAKFASHPKFAGVRHVVQDEPDDSFMLRPDFLSGIGRLKQFNLCYDILIFPKQLPAAIELVALFPEQQFVLDHLAKPLIKDRRLSPWQEQLRELAKAPNVCCKVSGLITEAEHGAWQNNDFRPYMDVAFEAFGEDRLLFGSDWPVCLLSGSYAQVVELLDNYLSGFDQITREKIWGGNTARIYDPRVISPAA